VTRARSKLYNGHAKLMLMTERFHYFTRLDRVKGVRRVVFYSLPLHPLFFKEMVEWVEVKGSGKGREGAVKRCPVVVVSRLDWWKVERIFGSKHAGRILPVDCDQQYQHYTIFYKTCSLDDAVDLVA
jgi:U3 small nucleolar RNA-associated protein 25